MNKPTWRNWNNSKILGELSWVCLSKSYFPILFWEWNLQCPIIKYVETMLSRQHEKATFISQITLGPDPHCLWLRRGLQRWCQQPLRNLGAETTALLPITCAEVLICNMKEQSDSVHLELPEDKSLLRCFILKWKGVFSFQGLQRLYFSSCC